MFGECVCVGRPQTSLFSTYGGLSQKFSIPGCIWLLTKNLASCHVCIGPLTVKLKCESLISELFEGPFTFK